MDRFLITLNQGIHIRRHQANKSSELVRLFSTSGCQQIQWEPPKAIELHRQRLKEEQESSNTIGNSSSTNNINSINGPSAYASNNYDQSLVDFFIAGKLINNNVYACLCLFI